MTLWQSTAIVRNSPLIPGEKGVPLPMGGVLRKAVHLKHPVLTGVLELHTVPQDLQFRIVGSLEHFSTCMVSCPMVKPVSAMDRPLINY